MSASPRETAAGTAEPTLVILLHGIRTRAWWQGCVASIIENETGATVIPIKYGYFDLLRFLCPFRACRKAVIERIRKQIEGIREQFKQHKLIVFAHSFGTYSFAQVLLENPYFKFDRVVLCGSIIPENYDWGRVQSQIVPPIKRDAIINECGVRDVWPVLAKSLGSGYGATGTYGFGDYNVRDRFHPFKHSDYFKPEFIREYWVSAVRSEAPCSSPTDAAGQGTPAWFGLIGLFVKTLLITASSVGFLYAIAAGFGVQGHHEARATAIIGDKNFSGKVEWASVHKPLEPTTEPKLTVLAYAEYTTEGLEVWLELTRYPRRFVRFDAVYRMTKCKNGETDFCKPPLEELNISHIMTLTIKGRADHHGQLASLGAGMKDPVSLAVSKFHTDPKVFMKSVTQDQVAIGWSGSTEAEKQNLVILRRLAMVQLDVGFADGSHAYFSLEKGKNGARVIDAAVDDWLATVGQE
ncbi:hypothetical protein [Bradyrhizobium sp. WYCCWR 12699]|uniref:hypothetical protein n=1 Tax=Bradyrhizobium sp. WYCCWR 12699 TaxID=3064203 RepID=UPI0028A40427|nr:hypothetical protein [Bradyrhizobium sp. WYCCWR 12699]MDT4739932.1 hypothetical protein [Bradyrhizobium sp. WYCCWR 12699]